MNGVLRSERLGKCYGSKWALRDCSIRVQQGQVTALVGPNGAGKSTLLEIAAGLRSPSAGEIEVLGLNPLKQADQVLPRIGFVAQDHPLYKSFSVAEMLRFGREMNVNWDDELARRQLKLIGVDPSRKVGDLSGGQQAQIALVLALAKRPELLLLDEPVAAFDPLARREFLQLLMETVAETDVSVVLSSHILEDLERVCDSLVLLSSATVQLTGQIEDVIEEHSWVVGPIEEASLAAKMHSVVQESRAQRQVSMLVKLDCHLVLTDSWTVRQPSLEDIVLAYLQNRQARAVEPQVVEGASA